MVVLVSIPELVTLSVAIFFSVTARILVCPREAIQDHPRDIQDRTHIIYEEIMKKSSIFFKNRKINVILRPL